MAPIDERLAPLFRIGLLTLSLLASSFVLAADDVAMADPTEQDFLSAMPVVLSVSRLAQPLPEASGAITVVDREMIRASGFHELPDAGPRHSASAPLIQSLPKNFDVSLGIYYLGPMRWAGSGDLIPSYTRFDLRLAHRFKFGATNAEIAAGVQNLSGDYVDFNDVNILSRRAYLSVAAEF